MRHAARRWLMLLLLCTPLSLNAGGYTVPISGFLLNPILDTGYLFGSTVPSIMFPAAGLPPIAIVGGLVGLGSVTGITVWGGDPVNLVTGNFYHVERDLSIPGRGGLPLVFERAYNNRGAQAGPLCHFSPLRSHRFSA